MKKNKLSKMNKMKFAVTIGWLLTGLYAVAQTDSMASYRKFIRLGLTVQQQQPLHIGIQLENSSNLVLSPSDTGTIRGIIYMPEPGKGYMQAGELEQLLLDTVALLVHHGQERIYRVSDAAKLQQQFQQYMGSWLKDTALMTVAADYRLLEEAEEGVSSISLVSRGVLPYTNLTAATIKLRYNAGTEQPLSVSSISRRLLPIDPADSTAFLEKYGSQLVVPVRADSVTHWYFVQEQELRCHYLLPEGAAPELSVSLFIQQDEAGNWQPADRLKHYRVIDY